MALDYVKTENGNLQLGENGKPLVRDGDEGDPFELDALHLYSKVPGLQEEAKNHRLKAKEYQEQLEQYQQKFNGIEDPDAAREALEKMQNLKAGDLQKAEDVERIKKETEEAWKGKLNETAKGYDAKLAEKDEVLSQKDQHIRTLMVSNQFSASPYFNGSEKKTILTPDIAESYFGKHFSVEPDQNGQLSLIAKDQEGNVLYSRERPGAPASFDEAIGWIIDSYPQKDQILRAPPGGSGSRSGSASPSGVKSKKELRNAREKSKFIKDHGQEAYMNLPDS